MKNNKNKFRLGLLATVIFTKTSLAATYVAGQMGIFTFDADLVNHLQGSGRIAVGHLWDVKCLQMGVEGALQYSEETGGNVKYRVKTIDFLGVMDFYFVEKANLFFKLGPAYFRENVSAHEANSAQGIVIKGFLGVGYNVTSNVNLNLSFMRQGGSEYSAGGGVAMVGLRYTFNN